MKYIILTMLLSGCVVVPRDGQTPEVHLTILKEQCAVVKLREAYRGIVVHCINYY